MFPSQVDNEAEYSVASPTYVQGCSDVSALGLKIGQNIFMQAK